MKQINDDTNLIDPMDRLISDDIRGLQLAEREQMRLKFAAAAPPMPAWYSPDNFSDECTYTDNVMAHFASNEWIRANYRGDGSWFWSARSNKFEYVDSEEISDEYSVEQKKWIKEVLAYEIRRHRSDKVNRGRDRFRELKKIGTWPWFYADLVMSCMREVTKYDDVDLGYIDQLFENSTTMVKTPFSKPV